MNRWILPCLATACLALAPIAATADDADAAARKIAEKVTTEGAAIFDTYNAHAMAATYAEASILTIYTKEDGKLKREVREGREGVEAAYAELFKNPETIKSANHVEHARLVSPDVLVINGTFDTNSLKPDSPKVPFHQVRSQKDGKWLVSSMEIYLTLGK
ncbi:hypothetical protein [Planctomyces sp. SH-PL62]|uniref:hypothetical protein n=1 Tax=Planctomyces sp. SH-PL62 TaxID=1636152 RepID=UPI00078CDC21|nr:hypothetical protein [Planctomyces sp. SH-PL62]AMV35902.1 hypothetical protein VT85_00560 [Planctomyces sp. SH-PL62]